VRTRPLAEIGYRELRALLEEETRHWGEQLYWDFSDVAAAVAGSLDRRTLCGRLIQDGPRAIAYGYYMADNGRAVVGSLFATEGRRGEGLEEQLLEAILGEALSSPIADRVECQTLFSTAEDADRSFASHGFSGRRRHYLVRELAEPVPAAAPGFRLRPMRREDIPAAARIVYESHAGSLDAALNMTYATPASCRAFVETLMLRSGCGRFDTEASLIADGGAGGLGVVLASRLSARNGHLCQVSVVPGSQGSGLGRRLVLASLEAFRSQGLLTASLSVTVDNARAYGLYQRLGFRLRRSFYAHAWVRPPARLELPA
jgi:ribosomal protein S18 acetylase RimI-like enzyme